MNLTFRNLSKYNKTVSMVLIYSPDGSNVLGSRGGELEGIGTVQKVESSEIVFLGGALPIHSLRHFCCRKYRLATIYFITVRQTTVSC